MDYSVMFGKEQIGRAQVLQEGLYSRVICRCRLTGNVVCRLEVSSGNQKTNLGILVPQENGFGLDTRIPSKKLGSGPFTFSVLPKHETMEERIFVPIRPEEPFAYIARLKDAFLENREGKKGASIPRNPRNQKDQMEISSSTGQWSEPKISG